MELFKRNPKKELKLDTIKDKITAYMIGELEEEDMSEEEMKILARWQQIWGFLNNHYSPAQAVEAHVRMQEGLKDPISRRTAYRDLRYATDLWSDVTTISRKSQLILIYEFAVKTFQIAAKQGILTEMNKAVANLVKVAKETEEFLGEEFEGHTYVLELSTGSGTKSINLDHLNQISKTDYYEIIDAVENEEITAMDMRKLLTKKTDEKAADTE
jgi:hypothetical protein